MINCLHAHHTTRQGSASVKKVFGRCRQVSGKVFAGVGSCQEKFSQVSASCMPGTRGKHQTKKTNPWCTSRGCRVQSSGPWDTWLPVVENNKLFARRTHSTDTAHGVPPKGWWGCKLTYTQNLSPTVAGFFKGLSLLEGKSQHQNINARVQVMWVESWAGGISRKAVLAHKSRTYTRKSKSTSL